MTLIIQNIKGDIKPIEAEILTASIRSILIEEIHNLEIRLNSEDSARLLDVNEACDLLNCSPSTIRRLKDKIGYSYVGGKLKFQKGNIQEYLSRRTIKKASNPLDA